MSTHFENNKFDLRTMQRSLREGKITQKEWEAHLKSLPDESANSEALVLKEEEKREPTHAEQKEPTFALVSES